MKDTIAQYLIHKRIFIFLDEWFSYFILYVLWRSEFYYLFSVAVLLSVLFNSYAYKCYWKVEDKCNDYLVMEINRRMNQVDTDDNSSS